MVIDRVHHMNLTPVRIAAPAQHLAVDRNCLLRGAEVLGAESIDVTLQRRRGDFHHHPADHRDRRDLASVVPLAAAEVTAFHLTELITSKMDLLVAARTAEHRRGVQRQHRRQMMASALGLTEVPDRFKMRQQRLEILTV